MGIDQQLVEEIVRRILSVSTPDRIILFGSAATGQMTPDSDIDLMILEKQPSDPLNQRAAIRQALFGLGQAFDLIILPTEKYEREKDTIGTAAWPAAQTGKVIYAAA
ncbi:nucleotidyltransferase domain-containing protein [bacterium]|nr:nucleotidyltransferase domain-containing protein [bacterium]